ncbi:MAG: HAD-IIB family hydrolase, partial [Campylobacterota bacterium]|nr:HAD-IIB family hydrolase [Campylobacterota bacterium]
LYTLIMSDSYPDAQEKRLIFTDLDGTLLDHYNYSFEAALPMLDYLKQKKLPVIIVSSKTRPEIIKLQKALDINEPFIVENGAGIFIPPHSSLSGDDTQCWQRIELGKEYRDMRTFFTSVQEAFSIRGFGDMTADEVIRLTGLSETNAKMAMQRDFTEPFISSDEQRIPELKALANQYGLDIVKGGRFYHLITLGQDKANAVDRLCRLYSLQYGGHPKTIALGDSENDFTMLDYADQPILIPKGDGTYADIALPSLIKAHYPGPKGWNQALSEYLHVS